MFSIISLLIIACAVTINAQASPQECIAVQTGVLPTNHPVHLQPVEIGPYVADWRVTIPPVPECVYGVSGVHAIICDADVAPSGHFVDFWTLDVHRNGNLQSVGTVTVTVYCKV